MFGLFKILPKFLVTIFCVYLFIYSKPLEKNSIHNYMSFSPQDVNLINELGYRPIMSEYGDIGYLPSSSAAESDSRTLPSWR